MPQFWKGRFTQKKTLNIVPFHISVHAWLLFFVLMTISITKLYELLSLKPGKETAENLTTFIEQKIKTDVDNKTQVLATKEDVAKANAENIKWMFIFWIGQVLATFGFILLFIKK